MVSVVIPCFNSRETIVQSLQSVIKQTYKNYEVIIVDDGSTDGMEEIIYSFFKNRDVKYKYIYQENSGPSKARNVGVFHSQGEYVAFLDSDDEWHPQKLEIICTILDRNPEIALIGHSHTFEKNFHILYDSYKKTIVSFWHLLLKNFAVTPSVVMRSSITEKFDESMKHLEDQDLWLRISLKHSVSFVNLPLVLLNRVPLSVGGISSDKWAMRKGEIKMYIKIVQRKHILIPLLPFFILFSLIKYYKLIIWTKKGNK